MAWPKGTPRPPGAGRKKGTPNRATAELAARLAETGETPLEFMLATMRDIDKEFHVRLDAAKSAAPYIHPKLAAIEHTGKDGGPMQFENLTDGDLDAEIDKLEEEITSAEVGEEAPNGSGGETQADAFSMAEGSES